MDELFLHVERSGLPMHIGSIALYESPGGPPDFAKIRESVRRGVLRAPVLRQRLVNAPLFVDRPYWIDAGDFDLDDHVCEVALPEATWEQLCAAAARAFEKPLDLERPPWRLTVIRNLEGGGFALVTQVHHAVLDGVSGVDVMRAFHDASADAAASPLDAPEAESEPGTMELLARAGANTLSRTLGAARLAMNASRGLLRTSRSSRRSSDAKRVASARAPRTRFNERPTSSRVVGGCLLDLAEVQAVRAGVEGATVNDVLLAVCGGALHRYLDARGELPAEPVVAMAPISIRSESSDAGGNRVAMMSVPLDTAVDDPLQRLAAIRGMARVSKKRTSDMGSSLAADASDLVPSWLGELAARAYRVLGLSSVHPPMFNCVVTNVAGPREPLFLAGSRMVANYGLGPIFDGMGLMHAVLSYCGGITITFTSCPGMLPDPGLYERCLLESFEELAKAASARAPV
jgi:WS/DGAT/MGAT family acyltransferase